MKNTRFDIPLTPEVPRQVQLKRLQAVIQEVLTPAQREMVLDYYFHQMLHYPKSYFRLHQKHIHHLHIHKFL